MWERLWICTNGRGSYFVGEKDIKTRFLVQRIAAIEFIVTANEYEALILENNLIKQWTPRYNVNLKDGKSYPVIRITADEFPPGFQDPPDCTGRFRILWSVSGCPECRSLSRTNRTTFSFTEMQGKTEKTGYPLSSTIISAAARLPALGRSAVKTTQKR